MRRLFALAWVLLVPGILSAESYDWGVRTETGWFNRGYQDRQFLTPTDVTFGVPYVATGAELRRADDEGNVLAWGLAQTTITAGRVYNWDRWEVQPLEVLTWASVSVGKDYGWMELDLGLGALIQFKDFDAGAYWAADGTQTAGRSGGFDWNRRESFTLLTGLFRLFRENEPHLVVSLARGPLSLAENLLHVQAVWPMNGSRLDAEIGFSSPMGLFFHGDGVLRSNERISLGWQWGRESRLGIRAGLLLRTLLEGSGEVDLWHRLSIGVDWSMGVTSSPRNAEMER